MVALAKLIVLLIAAQGSASPPVQTSVSDRHHISTKTGVFVFVGTSKIGEDVRVCLRSLAVNAPGTSVKYWF
jgi:hypothetical protein